MPEPAVLVRDLVIRYGARTAVAGLSFEASAAAVTALVGPNGAGKTSTVEACVGLRSPDSGEVRVLGARPGSSSALHARIGVMLQDGGLYATARPLELVAYVGSLYPRARDAAALLADLGLDPATRTPVRRLSGGEQQRLKCALALVGCPDLVFLDEPTTGLDTVARRAFHDRIRALVAEGTSVVLTTHLMDDVERLADHVVVVARGTVVADGSVADLVGTEESVTFTGPLHADIGALQAVLPDDAEITEDPPGRYRVTGAADPMVLSAIASWCAQHGVRTADLRIGRRPLEDVVLDLVGEL